MDGRSKNKSLDELWESSYLAGGNAAYLEQLYENFLADPNSIDDTWRERFETLPSVNGTAKDVSHEAIKESFRQLARQRPIRVAAGTSAMSAGIGAGMSAGQGVKQAQILQFIDSYRFLGHLQATLDPLGMTEQVEVVELRLAHYGLTEQDLETIFQTGTLSINGENCASLQNIIDHLKALYCGNVGVEYMHIAEPAERNWIMQRVEAGYGAGTFSDEAKKQLLDRITAAEGLERYLHTKYTGQKRFSLEGAESLIPMLDKIVKRGGSHGVKEIIVGMAHRGRLNVLINIMGKNPADLFLEFEGKARNNSDGTGDVKYHLGFSSNINTPGGPIHMALAFNPSHLEIVGPVVEGSVRARQEGRNDYDGDLVIPIVIHGDAAFAGQGVVMETFNMSQSRGYATKGTIHIVINNQVGFTTSNQKDSRSTMYCTDVAKMVNAPIFHVNSDDPEAVLFVTQVALDYRMAFHKDVVIDLVCYRRHGHSEADEPSATQPLMYQHIKAMKTTRALYAEALVNEGVIDDDEAKAFMRRFRDALDAGNGVVPEFIREEEIENPYTFDWKPYLNGDITLSVDTRIELSKLRQYAETMHQLPDGFVLHANVNKIFTSRHKMAAGALPVDWGFAENMAYATLLKDGFSVRLSGQDCGRGTFFHRHAVLYNQQDGETHVPLRYLADESKEKAVNFLVINSLLSEEAVLAFEYGYSTTDPNTLTIWEAQFGDFANNAQVVIDQFISAGEQKWGRLSGLVMLLPHGYEGQGPEHSSARLERYMQLCAQHNMQVCMPTTPAQMFHLLRRQMLMKCRKPLIVMTPKSLLRHRRAVNSLEDLCDGRFQMVIPEVNVLNDDEVKRVVICSGKVYYDIFDKREQDERKDVAVLRIEQLYPFPKEALKVELDRYPNATKFIWCQEEPMNQGAWFSSQHHMRTVLGKAFYLEYAGRPFSAAPAVGYMPLHIQQLQDLLEDALGEKPAVAQ